jgi:hypothetical protein
MGYNAMMRRLFTFASAVSLLLFAVTVCLWIASVRYQKLAVFWARGTNLDVGRYRFNVQFRGRYEYIGVREGLGKFGPGVNGRFVTPVGTFTYNHEILPLPPTYKFKGYIAFPAVWMIVFWLLLPTLWFILWLRRRLSPDPLACRTCGYNLTGNISGVCPECGTPVPLPVKSSAPHDKSPRPA